MQRLRPFERGRPTEIDFINGYVADVGRTMGTPTPANATASGAGLMVRLH